MTDIDRDILKAMQDLTVALGKLTEAVEGLQAEVDSMRLFEESLDILMSEKTKYIRSHRRLM